MVVCVLVVGSFWGERVGYLPDFAVTNAHEAVANWWTIAVVDDDDWRSTGRD